MIDTRVTSASKILIPSGHASSKRQLFHSSRWLPSAITAFTSSTNVLANILVCIIFISTHQGCIELALCLQYPLTISLWWIIFGHKGWMVACAALTGAARMTVYLSWIQRTNLWHSSQTTWMLKKKQKYQLVLHWINFQNSLATWKVSWEKLARNSSLDRKQVCPYHWMVQQQKLTLPE